MEGSNGNSYVSPVVSARGNRPSSKLTAAGVLNINASAHSGLNHNDDYDDEYKNESFSDEEIERSSPSPAGIIDYKPSPKKLLKSNKKTSPEEKLNEIREKLADVRKQRRSHEDSMFHDPSRIKSKPSDGMKTSKKKPMHHPNLGLIYGEMLHSPYLSDPLNMHYDRNTLQIQDKILDLKGKGLEGCKYEDLPEHEKLYDVEEYKETFLKTVANYKKPPISPTRSQMLEQQQQHGTTATHSHQS